MDKALTNKIYGCFTENGLVGDVVFSDEEYHELIDYLHLGFRVLSNSHGEALSWAYDKFVFVAIVNAIKKWECEETRFWDTVSKELVGTQHNGKLYRYYTDVIDRLTQKKHILAVSSYGHNYYATVCCHAMSPKKSLYSFFDMCWSIYCKDFDYTSGSKEDIVFVAESLNKRFANNTNETKELSLGRDVYSVLVGIRGLCVDHLDVMINFLTEVFNLIDKRFNEKPPEEGDYLSVLLNSWWKEKQNEFGSVERRSASQRGRVVSDYSRINAKYVLQENEPYLYVPPFRLKDNIFNNPYISIYSGSECIETKELTTRGSGLMMATKPFQIKVDRYIYEDKLADIRIEIEHCGKVIYSSKNTLNRDFLLFRNNREILSSDAVPANYSMFIKDIDNLSEYPSQMQYLSGCRYVFSSNEGDVLQGADKLVVFQEELSSRSIYKKLNLRKDVVFQDGEKEYSVIDGNLKIVIDSEVNPNSVGVRYDGEVYKLPDFTSEKKDSREEFSVSENIPVGEPKEIQIFDYLSNRTFMVCNIIKFKNICIEYDKPLYYDLISSGNLRFKTEKYDEKASFTIFDSEVAVNLNSGKLVFSPPIFRWRFEGGDWNVTCLEACWYKTIANTSKLDIDLPTNFEGSIILNPGSYLDVCSDGQYLLGERLYEIADKKEVPFVNIVFRCSTINDFLPLANIYIRDYVRPGVPLLSLKDKLHWKPEGAFIGDENRVLNIKMFYFDETFFQVKAGTMNQEIDVGDVPHGKYRVEVYSVSGGFLNKTETLIFSEVIFIGDTKEYIYRGKILKLRSVTSIGDDKTYRLNGYYIDNIVYLGQYDETDYYSGNLFQYDSDGKKKYLSSIKLPSGYSEKVNPVRIEFRDEDSLWLVYGLNEEDVYDFNGEFTLNNQLRLTIQTSNVFPIDYYNFRVEE